MVGDEGFTADDLLQGKVGDCWFLSALAVVAERPDLIMRLFGGNDTSLLNNPYGIVQVKLFLDGYWRSIVMDNFLPCIIDEKAEQELQTAIHASINTGRTKTAAATTNDGHNNNNTAIFGGTGHVLSADAASPSSSSNNATATKKDYSSSKYDAFALSDKNRQVLSDTKNLLEEHQKKQVNPYAAKKKTSIDKSKIGQSSGIISTKIPKKLHRVVTTEDLAYSKAKKQQLWVPFLEKAYAKAHGSYQAISGGHIAEAFLDLTGAPTKVYHLHNDPDFNPRQFWYELLTYRRQRLPMGCGTDSSQVGIIGMHAYSILDVREVRNVGVEFFRDKLFNRTLGNVSGFTEFDGTVRLLRIRNPHGKGEWQGEFSDRSDVWERLLQHTQSGTSGLERTMKNDGTFWMDYDSFLMGFSNVDVVMAYQGNHGKSFHSTFPKKTSNHRCTRAFEVSLVDVQPGVASRDTVELYVMGIQKTKRGASHGRADRKVSYKICDMGILVGENPCCAADEDASLLDLEFGTVEGEMFGFQRNGHYRLILDRKKNKRLIVMPISFGHPAATDKEQSFVLRFVADAPLLIRELPEVPRMDKVLQTFCFEPFSHQRSKQRKRKVLLDDTVGIQKYGEPRYRVFQIDCLANGGGVVMVYLCVNDRLLQQNAIDEGFSVNLSFEATCRGMNCRTETGYVTHETLAKGKKFQAAWRKFSTNVYDESKTRLLMVLVQSGQDSEMGTINCKLLSQGQTLRGESPKKQTKISFNGSLNLDNGSVNGEEGYGSFGVFKGDNFLHLKKRHAAIFGRNPAQGLASNSIGLDAFDLELERALALSRGDIEMQEVLELSKQDNGPFSPGQHNNLPGIMSEEEQMHLALEQSRSDNDGGIPDAVQDFQKAVATSLGQDEVEMVDLSSEDNALKEAVRRSLQEASKKSPLSKDEVIDVDDDRKPAALPLPAAKRQKTTNKEDDVIEILEDDDEDAFPEANNNSNGKQENTSPKDKKKSAEISLKEKRRLAAEAALKRFKTWETR